MSTFLIHCTLTPYGASEIPVAPSSCSQLSVTLAWDIGVATYGGKISAAILMCDKLSPFCRTSVANEGT